MTYKESFKNLIGNVLIMKNPNSVRIYDDDDLEGRIAEFGVTDEEQKERLIEYCFYHSLCPGFSAVKCIVNNKPPKRWDKPENEVNRVIKSITWEEDNIY